MSRYFKLFPTVTIIPFYLCTIQQRITNTLQKKNKNNSLIYFYFINCSYFHLLKSWLVIEYSAKTPRVFGFYIISHHNDIIVLLLTEHSVVNVFINKLKQFTTIPINVL